MSGTNNDTFVTEQSLIYKLKVTTYKLQTRIKLKLLMEHFMQTKLSSAL